MAQYWYDNKTYNNAEVLNISKGWLDATDRIAVISSTTFKTETLRYLVSTGIGGQDWAVVGDEPAPTKLLVGREYVLPDGAVLRVDDAGDYQLDDAKAKVIYRANRNREFNPYVNASELLAQFVEYLATLGIRARDLEQIPIPLFINWLIIRAAEADNDPVPAGVRLLPKPQLIAAPHCEVCGQFIHRVSARRGFLFCGPSHAQVAEARVALEKAA